MITLHFKYTLTCNFSQYRGLISAIPRSWKKLLYHANSGDSTTPPPPNCTITCKMLYDKLVTLENLPSPTSEKKLLSYGIARENLNTIYLLPFKATKEVKLAIFQHKNYTQYFSHEQYSIQNEEGCLLVLPFLSL